MAQKLTAYPAALTGGLATGPSIDYLLAQAINPGPEGARRPALNLMVGRPGGFAGLDYISYSGPGRPSPPSTILGTPTPRSSA